MHYNYTMKTTSEKRKENELKLDLPGPFWQVVGLGVLAGMRTFSAPVIVSHILSTHPSKGLEKSPLNFMQSDKAALIFKILAVGELVGDKLPNTPNRTAIPGIVGRCLAGAVAGASVFKVSRNSAVAGAIIGSVAAFGSTFGCYYLRKIAGAKTGIADPIVGAIEDALVVSAGAGLIITA